MKKAFINISLCLIFSYFVLYLIQYVIDSGLKKSRIPNLVGWNDIYGSKINADILICGASRAILDFAPGVIDSVLGTNTYNLAVNGAMFPEQQARLKIYLLHNKKPKYIIQNVDFMLFTTADHMIDYDQFIPYLGDSIIRNLAARYKITFTAPELYIPLFKYNDHLALIMDGIYNFFNFGPKVTSHLYKGFYGITHPFDNCFEKTMKDETDDLKNGVKETIADEFRAYLDFCKQNDIKVIFVYAPVYREAVPYVEPDSSRITRLFQKYAKDYQIPFISYINDTIGNHKELFIDHVHLNVEGARIISRKFAGDLKNLIN